MTAAGRVLRVVTAMLVVGIVCFVLVWVAAAQARDVSLVWDANVEEDLAGYRMFCRQVGQDYNYEVPAWEGTATTCTITVDGVRDYQFVARAYDVDGNESNNSNEVRLKVPPGKPCLLRFLP